jgi:ADP-heptose:LPS heptosyltransferase
VHETERHVRLFEHLGLPAGGSPPEQFPLTATDEAAHAATLARYRLVPGRYAVLHPGASAPTRRWPAAHFAAVMGTSAVTVFLAGDPVRWAYDGGRQSAVAADVPCAPCPHPVCPIDLRCAASVPPEVVLSAARELTGTGVP